MPTGEHPSHDDGGTDGPLAGATTEPAAPACSIARSLEVLGDRWTILILRDAFRGLRRFDELRRDLDIPRAVLSDRLRRLVDAGVLVRRRYQDRPPRDEYRLTPMGRELSPILVALMHWGDRWLSEEGPPTLLVHEPCGTEIDLGFYCWTCEQPFGPTDIASRPGPGAADSPTTRSRRARPASPQHPDHRRPDDRGRDGRSPRAAAR